MSKQIATFKNNKLNQQFKELLFNIDPENHRYGTPHLISPDGTKYKLTVDNDGNLDTEEVE